MSSADAKQSPQQPAPHRFEALARRQLAAEAGVQTISEAFAAAGERVYTPAARASRSPAGCDRI
jgi:hypothetical protein